MEEFYDPETKVITVPAEEIKLDHRGLGCILYESMKKNCDKIAQIDAVTGEKRLYSTYLEKCTRTAMKMRSLGVTHEDVISVCSHNQFSSTVPLFAAFFLGAKTACLDPTLSPEDTRQLLDIVKSKMVFVSEASERLIADAVEALGLDTKIVVFGESVEHAKFADFEEFECEVDGFKPREAESLEEIALIAFSSGTTGLPKGICHSHKALLYNTVPKLSLPVTLGFATLYWISANFFNIICSRAGTAILLAPKFEPKSAWEYMSKYAVNFTFVAPCDAISLTHNQPETLPTGLNVMFIGGSGIAHSNILKMRELLPNTIVSNGYGQTELIVVFVNLTPDTLNKPGCVGYPIPARSYKVVDPETEQNVGPNQEGELRVKSEYSMSGYHRQNAASAWDEEGYIKTGDIVYYDNDFSFFIVDRIKEMFKYKSWHIVPAKLEAILHNHPDVMMGVVVGVPHPEVDNHATAVVILKKGRAAKAEDIKRFVDEQVDDRHQLRGGVKIVDSMPLTPTSKVKRRELVKMIVNGEI